MAVVGLFVAIPITIFVSGEASSPPAEPLAAIEIEEPAVGPLKVEEGLGVRMRVPEGWSREQKGSVLELESKDRAARIVISAPGPASDAAQLHSEVIDGLRSSYRDFEIAHNLKKTQVGGLDGSATVASGTIPRKKGVQQKILVSTAKGKDRAYLVVVFTGVQPSPAVVEAQALVNNLRFTK